MPTRYNNKTAKELLVEIKALVVNSRIYDTTKYRQVFNALSHVSPTITKKLEEITRYEPGWIFAGADFSSLTLATLWGDPHRKPFELGETLTA